MGDVVKDDVSEVSVEVDVAKMKIHEEGQVIMEGQEDNLDVTATHEPLPKKKKSRVVIKIGTSSLVKTDPVGRTHLDLVSIAKTVEVCASLRNAGHEVVLVSSGAVGVGCTRVGLDKRPEDIAKRQALAAMGQVHLMAKYDLLLTSLGQVCAQVLLTDENFVDREHFIAAKATFQTIFELGDKTVPIVNENDSVGIHKLKPDNDKLSAMVSNLIGADLLFLMTDVDGVFTSNPNTDPEAKLIRYVENMEELKRWCKVNDEGGSPWGTGGMGAKIDAAFLATSLGVRTIIMNAEQVEKIPGYVQDHLNAEPPHLGTTFGSSDTIPRERKRWIRSLIQRGVIKVDEGAKAALKQHKNLFASGVVDVEGFFSENEAVSIVDLKGEQIAYGLANLSSVDSKKIMGMNSLQAFKTIGCESAVIVERENMDVQMECEEIDSVSMVSDVSYQ